MSYKIFVALFTFIVGAGLTYFTMIGELDPTAYWAAGFVCGLVAGILFSRERD